MTTERLKAGLRKAAWGFALLLASACGSSQPDPANDSDVVVTVPNQSFPFREATTYVLPNTVAVIQDPSNSSANSMPLSVSTNNFVVQTVANALQGRGYLRLTDPNGGRPSFFVQISQMVTATTSAYYSGWYPVWGSYYAPYYGASFGAGWSTAPVAYVTSATLGTLVIEATDPNHPDTSHQKIPSVWVAVINGVIDGADQATIQQRIDAGITQAFAQSPYFSRSAR